MARMQWFGSHCVEHRTYDDLRLDGFPVDGSWEEACNIARDLAAQDEYLRHRLDIPPDSEGLGVTILFAVAMAFLVMILLERV